MGGRDGMGQPSPHLRSASSSPLAGRSSCCSARCSRPRRRLRRSVAAPPRPAAGWWPRTWCWSRACKSCWAEAAVAAEGSPEASAAAGSPARALQASLRVLHNNAGQNVKHDRVQGCSGGTAALLLTAGTHPRRSQSISRSRQSNGCLRQRTEAAGARLEQHWLLCQYSAARGCSCC